MKILGIVFLAVSSAVNAGSAGSLREELAAERGVKLVGSDPLGSNKSGALKAEILGCGGQPLQNKSSAVSTAKKTPDKGAGSNAESPVQDEFNVAKVKEQLMDMTRLASNSRYQASLAGAQKKKTCNIKLADD